MALLEMREGDRAAVVHTRKASGASEVLSNEYHIRFVRVPEIQFQKTEQLSVRFLSTATSYGWLFGAIAFHLLILVGISFLPSSDPQAAVEEARFAEVSMKSIKVEPPPPEVKPPEPEEIKPEAPAPVRTMKPAKVVRSRSHAAPRPSGAQNALAALDMLKPADSAPVKDVVTNINAVSVPADTRSRFKVGGAIGKLPVGEVRVSTAGVASDSTSSSRELLSKNNVGALKGAGGTGNVRGVVKQTPQNQLQAAGLGRLSRAQIQKVINEHVAQVQACYEKNLMRDHSLAGKITFDWVIAPTGSVASIRVRSSTMAGSSVSTCIMQEVRGSNLPTPEGGSVAVTYPFIFSAQGF